MNPPFYQDRVAASAAADKLKVFAQPQRLMILSCLLRGERNVSEIGDVTQVGQPALSQQLAELRRTGLVQTRKEAKQVWYQLADDGVALCVRTMEAIFGGRGTIEDVVAQPAQVADQARPTGVAGFARVLDPTPRQG